MRFMLTKFTVFAIIFSILNLSFAPSAFAQSGEAAERTAKIKSNVAKIGKDKKVVVRLMDKTRLKGTLTAIDNDSFAVTNKKDGTTTFKYSEVDKDTKTGTLSKTTVIGIAAAAAVAAIVLITFGRYYCNEQAC
jgi:small nuclear ribonucleoprotein (snRNP)-like protein